MKFAIETITPHIARKWMEHNTDNRAIKPGHVETIRLSLERGEYVVTHQGIAFDMSGVLLDGQHRLAALAQMPEGFEAKMLVCRGLEREKTFQVIDATLAKRTTADLLRVSAGLGGTAAFLAGRIYSGSSVGLTPTFTAQFVEYILPEWEELFAFAPKNTKFFSSAAVRAAAVMQMKRGHRDHTLLVYRALTVQDFETMPPIAQALARAAIQGRIGAVRNSADLFARCVRVFTPKFSDVSRVLIKDHSTAVAEAREMLHKAIFGATKKTAPAESRGANGTATRRNASVVGAHAH